MAEAGDGSGQPDPPDAAALAAQLAAVKGTLAENQKILADLRGQLAVFDQRMDDAGLDGMPARIARLAQLISDSLDAATPKGPALPRWDTLEGTARDLEVARVRKWVAKVLRPAYVAGGVYELPACWHQHEQAVAELSWLSILWRYIWDRPRPGPVGQAAEWHDRWLPGVMRRLDGLLAECKFGHVAARDTPGGVNHRRD